MRYYLRTHFHWKPFHRNTCISKAKKEQESTYAVSPGDLVTVLPFPAYYPDFLAKSEQLVGKTGMIIKKAETDCNDPADAWIVFIDNKLLEFGCEELELANDRLEA